MKVKATDLPGVLVIEPQRFFDERGFFVETWNNERYEAFGIKGLAAQDNLSWSRRDVLRGLHYQRWHPQAKLVYALAGTIFDVAVDIRVGSSCFGRWFGLELSAENGLQFYIPEGFAHGFCVVSETALVAYKCNRPYEPRDEHGLHWSDRTVAIHWPLQKPSISAKDASLPFLLDIEKNLLPRYSPKKVSGGRLGLPVGIASA